MVTKHEDYRAYLKETLADRITANPAYSLRAFAKNLGLASSTLAEILAGKKKLSYERAHEVAARLKLSDGEREYFLLLVQSHSAKKASVRRHLDEQIAARNPDATSLHLSLDHFRSIADWYHFAILEHTLIDSPKFDPALVAKRLGITKVEVEAAIERLKRLELLTIGKDGCPRKVKQRLIASSAAPEDATRKFLAEAIARGAQALEEDDKKTRFIGSDFLAFDSKRLNEATQLVQECMEKIGKLSAASKTSNHVYSLNVQFFQLTKDKEKSRA